MRHAVYVPPFGGCGDVHGLVELAVTAETAGWDGFFLWDHVLYEEDVPFVDAWITCAAIATATSAIRLGPLVTPLARRRPWKVAREAITLDHLSNGRLVLGVGLGIDFWREFSAFREPATTDRARAELVDDGIELIQRLLTGDRHTFEGKRLAMDDVQFLPRPVQQPRVPIWSAVIWPAKRPGPIRRAARCDGVMPFAGGPMTPEQAADVRAAVAAERPGDDPFDLCAWGPAEQAADFEEAGVTWLIWSAGPEESIADIRAEIEAGPPR
jgi:alkanesulfonate monooxygenase SsuD/methylene tetrahydromethanopterin reductase-like flavin-dependent oxidoreductase (luciferase family)